MNTEVLQTLRNQLGQPALSYLLGRDPADADDFITETELTAAQEAVLELLEMTRQVRIVSDSDSTHVAWAHLLTGPSGIDGQALGTSLREFAGGSIPQIDARTPPLERTLMRIAVDAYPALLIHESFAASRGAMPLLSLHSHPLHDVFQTAADSDQQLHRLLTIGAEPGHGEDLLYRSTGAGMTFSPTLLVDQLINAAWARVNAAWARAHLDTLTPTVTQLTTEATRTLGRTRRALRGVTNVPARVGFTGVLLPEGSRTTMFGSARLRPADGRDRLFARMTGLAGGTSTHDDHGVSTSLTYAGDLVLEFDAPFAFTIRQQAADEPWPTASLQTARAFDTVTENLRLGLLLSSAQSTPSVYSTWRTVFEPLSFGPSVGWDDPARVAGLHPRRLTDSEVVSWQEWVDRVSAHRQHVGIAVRRLLLAINERTRPEDVLLDAVIVWENLFGVDERNETTEAVTDALACLLHSNKLDRDDARRRYRTIYSRRNDIVHGARTFDDQTLRSIAIDAVSVAVAALRHLFEHRPDILALTNSTRRNAVARKQVGT
ncbi:hypothetical protein [Curtobacterium sp. 1544]|uniref:hypothetical protein n=1 Tax=Curtobacterium sp. 1544 TaxID=3156417 RepID=UPI0033956B1A